MSLIHNLKIKHKLQVTAVLYLILISMVVYFFISSNTLIKRSSGLQHDLNELTGDIRHTEIAVQQYVFQRISRDELSTMFAQLGKRLQDNALKAKLTVIQDSIDRFHQIRSRDFEIETQITELTEGSLTASNGVIKELSQRLVGVDTRAAVSDMERAVIVGANNNTNANFRIKLLFARLKEDLKVKNELIQFLDTLVANVTKDIELLKGTANEAAARQAKKNNLLIKDLVLEFIGNVETLNTLEKTIFENLAAMGQSISDMVRESSNDVFDTIKGYFSTIIGMILVASVIGILANFLLGRSVSGSLDQLNLLVKDLAEGDGDLTKRIQVKHQDETGELAHWINLFVKKLHTVVSEISGNADAINNSSSDLTAISQEMSESTRMASDRSNSVASAAEEMSANMNSVAAASEEASTNVSMVASASEEMAITVKEIAKSSEKARAITNDAVTKATGTTTKINKLGEAADQISKVTEVITEISEQTNLLALNATIEAARAGEAGKGFAVVANEIKELAKQTAAATQEIKAKIEGIQHSSVETVDEIKVILEVISEVDTIVSSIATSVEEQSASTQEIAGNVAQASHGIREVNENVNQSSSVSSQIAEEIAEVNQTAGSLADSGAQVSMSATSLSELAAKLHNTVARFKL
jgi:methyl-accepting chemotaxis protein